MKTRCVVCGKFRKESLVVEIHSDCDSWLECKECMSKADRDRYFKEEIEKDSIDNHYLYKTYNNMKNRCYNKNNPKYKHYGFRGITVCDRWLGSFYNFLEDMGERPDGMSLDRIDNNRSYEPDNCRWATIEQQINNRRNTQYFSALGVSLTSPQWGLILEVHPRLIFDRVNVSGWSVLEAVTTPTKKTRCFLKELASDK